MKYTYKPTGVCSRSIIIEADGDTIKSVSFIGGCSGNTQGIGKLCEGMKIDDIIERLDGIRCGIRPTSCPAQLAQALREMKTKSKAGEITNV
jgi:uncharacterized protein (TIGR03905 family)